MAKDKADIWMPLYIGDYLADTTRLTTEQHGAYLLLIMDYWKSGRIPDNDAILSQITRMNIDAWSNARAMLKHFFSIENGCWVHHRIERELNAAKESKQKATNRAKTAAQKRWSKDDSCIDDAASNATSIAQALLDECPSPSPSPSPSSSSLPSQAPSTSKTPPLAGASGKKKKTDFDTVGFERFYDAFDKKVQRPDAERAWRKIAPNEHLLEVILTAAMAYVAATPDKKYRKNPATWLNGQCWNDEVIDSRPRSAMDLRRDQQQEEMDAFIYGSPSGGRIIDVN